MKNNRFCLFHAANSDWQILARSEFANTLQTCQGDFQTCLLQIGLESRSGLAALLVRGQIVNLYRPGQARRLASSDPFKFLHAEQNLFKIRVLALTPHTVRMVKILLEQRKNTESGLAIANGSIKTAIEQAGQQPEPRLAHLSWPGAQGLALLPGNGQPPRHTLFVASNQILHSAGSMAALYRWKEEDCRLKIYDSRELSPAWEEYFLHQAFAWLVSFLFRRFEELAGRSLVNTIVREMNFTSSAYSWNIAVSSRNITDQAVFSSPEEAGQVYQRLLEISLHHGELLLGQETIEMLRGEYREQLPQAYRTAFKSYIEQTKKSLE